MKPVWFAGLWLLSLAGTAAARTPAPPPEVVAAAQAIVTDGWLPLAGDEPDADAPRPPKVDAREIRRWQRTGLLKAINLTPGKAPDWLIDSEKTEYPSAWCGTGGCLIEIWSPGPDRHYIKTFHNQIRERHIRRLPGKDYGWLEVDFHGSMCGLSGVQACPWGFEWRDDGLGHFGLRASLRFVKTEGLHAGAAPQALDPSTEDAIDTAPDITQDLIATQQTICAGMKTTLSAGGLANRLPDLNSDGIDDWSYDGQYLACDYPDGTPEEMVDFDFCTRLDCSTRVWISRRDGQAVSWQPVAMDSTKTYALALHPGKPAGLVELIKPGGTTPCDLFVMADCARTPISLSPNP